MRTGTLPMDNDTYEEVLSYGQLLDHILSEDDTDIVGKYKHITRHGGLLKADHLNYNGSSYCTTLKREAYRVV